jgi:hypothetical protein
MLQTAVEFLQKVLQLMFQPKLMPSPTKEVFLRSLDHSQLLEPIAKAQV